MSVTPTAPIAPPAARPADPRAEAFAQLEKSAAAGQPAWVLPLRKAALARFGELGFPTLKHEDWRFTNVAPVAKLPFRPQLEAGSVDAARPILDRAPFTRLPGTKLVFVNGHFAPALSTTAPLPAGARAGSLAAALASDSALLEKHLGRYARADDNAFAALNSAFFTDGGFVYVPAGQAIEGVVHLLFIQTGAEAGATAHPRNLIVAEAGARVTVLETYLGAAGAPTLTNAVTEFCLGDDSVVEHCKLQDESAEAYHLATLHSHLGRAVQFTSHSVVTGARLSRNNIRTTLDGQGVEAVLNGVYLTNGEQLADHHMVVDHAKPHCASHEYFNGILAGKSRGVFHGRILVRPGAQKTDAKQTNKNLLLSDDASADAKPQLEIYADDVKCTHGATVGQLNEESIYYLRSRGIGQDTARQAGPAQGEDEGKQAGGEQAPGGHAGRLRTRPGLGKEKVPGSPAALAARVFLPISGNRISDFPGHRPGRFPWKDCAGKAGGTPARRGYIILSSVSAISLGVAATPMPAALKASILAAAVPLPPETMAPAWPMRRPGGAVAPAMKPATGLVPCCLIHSAASSSALPPISPIMMIPLVSGSAMNSLMTSRWLVPLTGSPPMPTQVDWPTPREVSCQTAS